MKERYVIAIETSGLALAVGTLIYAVGFLSTVLIFAGFGLVITAQLVKMR
jgi:type IV secretory pathway TrbD component